MNIIFNSLLAQLVKYDVQLFIHKIISIHAIFITYFISSCFQLQKSRPFG